MNKDNKIIDILTFVAVGIMLAASAGGCIYKASVQAGLYQREGIDVTTWEVLVGAKPAERTINMKERP